MTREKQLFIALSCCLCSFMLAAYLLISKWVPSTIATGLLFLLFLAVALAGRISGTLMARCSALVGQATFSPLVWKPTATISRRNIYPSEVRTTTSGVTEVSYIDFSFREVLKRLSTRGLAPESLEINLKGWRDYVKEAQYETYHPDYYAGEPGYLVHKQVQHYITILLAPIRNSEVWMDVASSTSPFPEILTRLHGLKVYRQDLSYPHGAHGLRIGSDATSIPIPDCSIDRISLHCAFEHFEGAADTRFINEVARILRPGGSACIIPLYVSDVYQILTNPRYWLLRGIPSEDGAQTTMSRTYWESFGRFYDAEALEKRIIRPLETNGLKFRFIKVELPREIEYPSFLVLEIRKPESPAY